MSAHSRRLLITNCAHFERCNLTDIYSASIISGNLFIHLPCAHCQISTQIEIQIDKKDFRRLYHISEATLKITAKNYPLNKTLHWKFEKKYRGGGEEKESISAAKEGNIKLHSCYYDEFNFSGFLKWGKWGRRLKTWEIGKFSFLI